MRKLLLLLVPFLVFGTVLFTANAASATYNKVVVCKYVGTPGVDETLQTGDNPIVVSVNALEGEGFAGVFPFEFEDKHGRSVAIRFSENPQDKGDISECASETPPPTTPPPTTVPPTTPPPTTEPPKTHTHTPTWTPTWTPTGGPGPGNHPLASTGFDAGDAAIAGGLLAALGLGSLAWVRRRSA